MKDKEKYIDSSWRAKMVENGIYKDSETTSEEIIEEMANDLEEEFVLCGILSNCGTKRCSRCFSKYLYEQGYRKLSKDSVLLTGLELADYKHYKEYTKSIAMVEKETIEKTLTIVSKAFEEKTDEDSVSSVLDTIATQLGVEIKEN